MTWQHIAAIAIWTAAGIAFTGMAAWEARDAIRHWRRRHNIRISTWRTR